MQFPLPVRDLVDHQLLSKSVCIKPELRKHPAWARHCEHIVTLQIPVHQNANTVPIEK